SCFLGVEVANLLKAEGISCEVVDLRVINPLNIIPVLESIKKTRRVIVLDGGWKNCGLAGEVIASIVENIDPKLLMSPPKRITISEAPAPTSLELEKIYYPTIEDICHRVKQSLNTNF
ncbi:MAG: alpha-ketoacid dehydrogenase subunit beta, partial [Alphaproteobacteria bacterium]|nr:alpha-ketoacid dehydrogenase subunit beta [Alphaproteobacteria bacterium]